MSTSFIPKVKLRCKKCEGVVQSKYSGEFSICTCGSVFVQEFEGSCNTGANESDYEYINKI